MLQEKPTPNLNLKDTIEVNFSKTGYAISPLDGSELVYGGCKDSEQPKILENNLPIYFSYKDTMPPIDDQGSTNQCVAFASASVVNAVLNMIYKTDSVDYGIDENVIYAQRTVPGDKGMYIKEALSFLLKDGIYVEKLGKKVKIKAYYWVGTIEMMKMALLMNSPLIVGIKTRDWYRSDFWNGPSLQGGHCIAITGYNDDKQCFEVRNSWGELYGDKGYWYLPYEDVKNAVYEAWCIEF